MTYPASQEPPGSPRQPRKAPRVPPARPDAPESAQERPSPELVARMAERLGKLMRFAIDLDRDRATQICKLCDEVIFTLSSAMPRKDAAGRAECSMGLAAHYEHLEERHPEEAQKIFAFVREEAARLLDPEKRRPEDAP